MPNINDINGVTVANLSKLDAVLKANISKVNGLTLSAAAAFLLDTYTGAAAAYSTRKLKTGVTVAARIRRSGDDIEADVEFDTNNEISLTSPISNASSGTYTDLADFVDHSTTPRDAFVKEWKDQSGSGNHATQSTPSEQPQLYDAVTGLIRNDNGNVAVEFIRQSSTSLSTPSFDMVGTGWFCVTVAERRSTVGDQMYIDSFGGVGDRTGQIFHHPGAGLTTMQATSTGGSGATVTGSITTNVSYIWTSENTLSNLNLYINGSSAGTASITSQGDDANGFDIGKRKGLTEGYSNTYSSEIIYWPSNQSSNRTAIETDINTEFLIYQPTDAPTSGLLATYTGAAAAYSVRQLSDKAVIAMRIRRDSDDEERNIGFDSNGDLATADISAFCGTANGYVTRWWDQSTNGNHATQSTGTNQPQIYNGTAVITENSKPALQFADTSDLLNMSATGSGSLSLFIAAYFSMDNAWTYQADNGLTSPDGIALTMDSQNGGAAAFYRGAYTAQKITGISAGQKLASNVFVSGTGSTLRVNGTTAGQDTTSLGTTAWAVTGTSSIFKQFSAGTVRAQEFVLYFLDQSSNRSGIETDINDYFSIY